MPFSIVPIVVWERLCGLICPFVQEFRNLLLYIELNLETRGVKPHPGSKQAGPPYLGDGGLPPLGVAKS